MKKALAILTVLAATSASATTVGLDYGYSRVQSGPHLSAHSAIATVKQRLAFGNVKLGVGTVQAVGAVRDNGSVFGLEYSYDLTTPVGVLSPAVGFSRVTGLAGGNVDTLGVGGTLRTPVATGVRLVTSVSHTELVSSGTYRSTTGGVGVEVDVTKSLTLKAGYAYSRLHTLNRTADGVTVGVEHKF